MEFPLTRLLHQRCHNNPTSFCLTLTLHGLISPIPIQDDVASMLTFREKHTEQRGDCPVGWSTSMGSTEFEWYHGRWLHTTSKWCALVKRKRRHSNESMLGKCVLRIGNLAWLFSCWNLESKTSQETSM